MGLIQRIFRPHAAEPPPADAPPPAQPGPPPPRPLDAVIALKVLEAHLVQRHQAMEQDPSRLEGTARADAVLLIRAMGAAAHADGGIDPLEQARIDRALAEAIPDEAERAKLRESLAEPPCLETLVRQAQGEDLATRFYAVSVRTVRRGVATNRAYLAYLANRLRLPPDIVARVNRRFDVPLYLR